VFEEGLLKFMVGLQAKCDKDFTSLHPISLWITGLKRAHNHRDFVQLQHLIRSSPPKSLHKYMNPMLLLVY
jgi:hypothetical protein